MKTTILSNHFARNTLVVTRKRRRCLLASFQNLELACGSNSTSFASYSTTLAVPYRATTSRASSVSETTPSYGRETERYAPSSSLHFIPPRSTQPTRATFSSLSQLDLELGDFADEKRRNLGTFSVAAAIPWDDNVWNKLDENDEDDGDGEEDDLIEEESATAPLPWATRNESQQQPEFGSTTDANSSDSTRRRQLKHQKSVMELLASFDPMNPPRISDYASREEALNAIQLWMECEAQQEAVSRYQKVIDDARARHDFSSLSMIQRQIVQWFGPLQEALEAKQKAYLQGNKAESSVKKFGPFICTLPPTKLAVIVAHEAVMKSIINGQSSNHTYSVLGVPLSTMAMRLGQAVEDELVVHRLLHKRSQDAAKDAKARDATSGFENDVSAVFGSIEDSNGDSPHTAEEDDPAQASNDGKSAAGPQNVTHKWSYAASHLKNYLEEISRYQPSAKKRRVTAYAIQRARQILDREDEWTAFEKMQLGAAVLQPLLETATIVGDNGRPEPAFTLEKHWIAKDKSMSFVSMNNRLFKMIVSDKLESLSATTTRHKPMVVPPKPWTAANDGGYQMLKVDLMRYHGCHTQREALRNAESSTVFDGLNALGRVKWKINKALLAVAQQCWQDNIPLGDIPSQTDVDLPEEPLQPAWTETRPEKGTKEYEQSVAHYKAYRERLARYNRVKQKIMVRITLSIANIIPPLESLPLTRLAFVTQDQRSLRCSVMLKLDQAEKFKNFDEIYFPYNMDFRGRAYPVPPHLSNVGSDLCRGMLVFAEGKPLGERGLYWLKVHLANFAGKDKVSFDDRAKFVDDNMDKVRASATDPFGGERWWMSLEDPFQGLATCFEVVDAIDSGDPATYMCSLPVHMDGSCNGLQHYAALGRDSIGGRAVNLCATEEPQDVYIGVMHEVVRRVAKEASREVDFDTSNIEALSKSQKKELAHNRAAKLVNGHIDRGVVKRTVMTSVYGVTYVGAREQIQEKVEEKVSCRSEMDAVKLISSSLERRFPGSIARGTRTRSG
jgi:DNA-directed RNA polymerase, mitochondrial